MTRLGGTLVLLYHRVSRVTSDPFGLAVRPDRFAQQCEILRRRFDVVPLREMRGGKGEVSITFDDGYADCLDARDILADSQLPATFFITSGRLGKAADFWSDRLGKLLLDQEPSVDHVELEIGGRPLWADIRSSKARERAHLALYWRLRPLPIGVISRTLDELATQVGIPPTDPESHRWMDTDELRALDESELVDVGSHTLTHPLLKELPPDEQWREIDGSRRELEALLATHVHTFSYPFGGPDTFDVVTSSLVRDAGYDLACTAAGGLVELDGDPFRIPRNTVGDWEADTFERWLDGWIGS
ncbi:MAG: polysaccharide deacetylase family protein [Actinomycetota bacterium]